MTTQPEALRLAELLEDWAKDYATTDFDCDMGYQAAAELRRLHEENEQLNVENRRLIDRIEKMGVPVGVGGYATTTKAQPEQEPVAVVSGYYGGQCVILPTNPARIFNSNTALYTSPPQPEQNEFNPDWDAMAVMVEEQQRMAKRIAELEAQPEQEPVAWVCYGSASDEKHTIDYQQEDIDAVPVGTMLYTTPPQRKPLTDVTIWNTYKNLWMFHPAEEPRLAGDVLKFARAIEAAHGIKE